MLKKLKKASAIALSCAMAIQFGLADSYYANTTTEQPVQEQEKQVTSANVQVSYVDKDGNTLDQTTQDYTIGEVLTPKSFDGYTYESATVNGNAVSQVTIAQDTTTVQFTYAKVEQDNTEAAVATQELTDEQQPVQDEQTNEDQTKEEQNSEETSEEEPNSEEEKENTQPEEESKQEEKEKEEEIKSEEKTEKKNKVSTQASKDSKATANETTKTYKLYHYALIPGKSMDATGNPDNTWYGLGVTNISGVDDPSTKTKGVQSNFTYTLESVEKPLYPDITIGEGNNAKTYKYAATGSENASKEGYYTLVPARVVIADGANEGKNTYNPTASGNTYHLDYTMVINETNIYTVTYEVLYPDETQFAALNNYSQRVNSGTSESKLRKPTIGENTESKTYDLNNPMTDQAGNKYTFDGWYTDEACTQKADFNGTVTANTFYYGKYVTKKYAVHYDSDGGSSVPDQTSLKYNDPVDTTDRTPTKEGFIFKGWYYGDNKVTKSKYSDLVGDESIESITLVAEWTKKSEIEVKAKNQEITYDGEKHTLSGFESETFTIDGNKYIVSGLEASVTGKDAGTYTSSVTGTAVVTDASGNDVTNRFVVKTKDGTLTINRKAVTVTADNKSKTYGEADPDLTATVDGTLGKDTVKYDLSRVEGEDAGTYTITASGDEKQGNYKVTYKTGTLTIKKKSIIPDGPDTPDSDKTGIKVTQPIDSPYDGNAHRNTPVVKDSKTDKTLIEDKDYTLTYPKDITNVGTVSVTVKGKGNYEGEFEVSYQITKRIVKLSSDSATKPFDGSALTRTKVTVGGDGFVEGEVSDVKAIGTITEVGSVTNEITYKTSKKFKAENYSIEKTEGTLTITPKSIIPDTPDTPDSDKTGITVSDPSDSKYDGKEHREVLTVKDSKMGKELVSGTDYAVAYSSDVVNAGTVTITVTGKGNYEGTFKKTYKITAREITLTSASDSKTYDGSALTNDSIKVSGDGFVEGEGATYEVTGSQTEVGNSANAFEYRLNKNTLASNYKITKVVGTLTVTRNQTPTTPTTPTTPSTPSTPSNSDTTTPAIPRIIQRIVNVISPTPSQTPSENVKDNKTPKAQRETETVEEDYTPKATRKYYWALINLICAILTVLFGLLLLISKRHKDDDEDEDEDDETQEAARQEDEDEEEKEAKKRGLFTRVLAVLIAILSVVLFVFTEDMSLPWTWVDKWTVWMVVIGLVQILVFFVGRKWKKDDDDDEEDEEETQQA